MLETGAETSLELALARKEQQVGRFWGRLGDNTNAECVGGDQHIWTLLIAQSGQQSHWTSQLYGRDVHSLAGIVYHA